MSEPRLRAIAARQLGLFTRRQARECGLTPYQVRHRISTGRWQVVLGSVLTLAGVNVTVRMRDRAAQLAVPDSVLGGPSAARCWGMVVPDERAYLLVGRHRRSRLTGVRLIRAPVARAEVQMVDGSPATTRVRTVLDCLRLLPERAAVDLLDRALQRGWITHTELSRAATGWTGRVGAPRLARLTRLAGSGARSAAERVAVRLLRDAGITGWVANAPVYDDEGLVGVTDVAFERVKLALEFDGWAYHVTPDRFQGDRQRQNRLVAAGWTVLRFTWRDLVERPAYVISTITSMLARLSNRAR
jgi:hypothetical protein